MQPSTLVLTALLQLHQELSHDDGFAGYEGDADAQARLLAELWEQYLAHPFPAEHPQELVDGWYFSFYENAAYHAA